MTGSPLTIYTKTAPRQDINSIFPCISKRKPATHPQQAISPATQTLCNGTKDRSSYGNQPPARWADQRRRLPGRRAQDHAHLTRRSLAARHLAALFFALRALEGKPPAAGL